MTDQYILIEAEKPPVGFGYRVFTISAIIGIFGWLSLLGLFIWWTVQPTNLPQIEQPIEVLNPQHEVAIGQPLVLKLEVTKTIDRAPSNTTRFLECKSGNLVTLTSSITNLPIGSYTVVSDNIVIPAKVTPGDTCHLVLHATFQINPIKTESTSFASEDFLVLPIIKEN